MRFVLAALLSLAALPFFLVTREKDNYTIQRVKDAPPLRLDVVRSVWRTLMKVSLQVFTLAVLIYIMIKREFWKVSSGSYLATISRANTFIFQYPVI